MTAGSGESFRKRVLVSGGYLSARQALGMAIHVVGTILVTREIGPSDFGAYAVALTALTYLFAVAQLGVGTYLVRAPELRPGQPEVAFTLLLACSVLAGAFALAAFSLLGNFLGSGDVTAVGRAMVLVLPIQLGALAPLALLERNLDYPPIAVVEVGGTLLNYLVAVPAAYGGLGVWAPASGWIVQQCFVGLAVVGVARFVPRLRWDRSSARAMLGYGVGFTGAQLAWQTRDLVNPLIVGRLAGVDAVGYVTVAVRIVQALTFVRLATWRLTLAALARVQESRERLVRAVEEGATLQVLAAGVPLALFALLAPSLVPALLGDEWITVVDIYPYLAFAMLLHALYTVPIGVLYVVGRLRPMIAFGVLNSALVAGAALTLVPDHDTLGYGYAEAIAVVAYIVVERAVSGELGGWSRRRAFGLTAVLAAALFAYTLWTAVT